MASPMRKKRAWSTRENDAESQETAAFEATVAAAQDTAAKSGAFLSTAKSDLTDHQRWLQAQSAAVERDRARHERWLQRQREHRLALARKDRARRRRQLMRQRAFRAMQAAAVASLLFVRSLILLAFAKTVAGLKSIGALIARGATSVARLVAASAQWTAALIARGAAYLARLIAAGARWTGAKLRALALWIGRTLSAGLAWSGAKAQVGARAGGSALAAGSSLVADKAGVLSRSAGRSIGSGFSAASATGSALAGATGRSASRGFAQVGEKTAALGASGKRQLAAGYRWSMARGAALAPALYVRVAKLGRQAERYARAKAARAEGVFERAKVTATVPTRGSEAPSAIVEIYGPHRDGVEIVGRAANDPWMPTAEPEGEAAQPEVQAAEVAEVYGPFYEGFWVEGVSPNEPRLPEPTLASAPQPEIAAPRAKGENALSSWAREAWYRAQVMAVQAVAWARSRFLVFNEGSRSQSDDDHRRGSVAGLWWASARRGPLLARRRGDDDDGESERGDRHRHHLVVPGDGPASARAGRVHAFGHARLVQHQRALHWRGEPIGSASDRGAGHPQAGRAPAGSQAHAAGG